MTSLRFNTAGWVAILCAVLTVPMIVVTIAAMFLSENIPLQILDTLLFIGTTALVIYVLVAFRQLLHSRDFHAADFWLDVQIGGYVVLVALAIVDVSGADAAILTGIMFVFALLLGLFPSFSASRFFPPPRSLPVLCSRMRISRSRLVSVWRRSS